MFHDVQVAPERRQMQGGASVVRAYVVDVQHFGQGQHHGRHNVVVPLFTGQLQPRATIFAVALVHPAAGDVGVFPVRHQIPVAQIVCSIKEAEKHHEKQNETQYEKEYDR